MTITRALKQISTLAILAGTLSLASGVAMAETIKGRVGVSGRIGFQVPADNEAEFGWGNNKTDTGLVGGGGLIYGIDGNWAAEVDLSHSSFDSDTGDFGVSDISLGAQYRFRVPDRKVVPYLGAGLDILITDYDPYDGASLDVDTCLGAHVKGGVDYFVTRDLALTAEAKFVLAPDTDITYQGLHTGDFDPSSFSGTIGVRYFFN
ncbi:porin family protein [Geomonas nitrogeniifigens]|uniref:Porin family protein n=1 Tax=Geomonas diazotrophica TaxID=2843197 RepID=A0ABX8JI36_9BACT|nr:porin family protein [Geomonas nitrogeniifigens]QWV96922.1 porin family protein [Geomonas nitrogeniifigens]QXE86098.1 porin family protein [Geomonas nitrogeniifigens]